MESQQLEEEKHFAPKPKPHAAKAVGEVEFEQYHRYALDELKYLEDDLNRLKECQEQLRDALDELKYLEDDLNRINWLWPLYNPKARIPHSEKVNLKNPSRLSDSIKFEQSDGFRTQIQECLASRKSFQIDLPREMKCDDILFIFDLFQIGDEVRQDVMKKLSDITRVALQTCSSIRSGKLKNVKHIECTPLTNSTFTDKVATKIVLDMDYNNITENKFKTEFQQELSDKLGVPKSDIQIQRVESGSIIAFIIVASVVGLILIGFGTLSITTYFKHRRRSEQEDDFELNVFINPNPEGQEYGRSRVEVHHFVPSHVSQDANYQQEPEGFVGGEVDVRPRRKCVLM